MVGVLGGCATYRPAPLPSAGAMAAAPAPDMERLRVAATKLHHPLLEPVTIDLSDGLSPDEAAVLAVLANPDLKAVRDAHGEAAAQLVGAGLLPNPVLTAELDQPRPTSAERTVNQYSFGLEQSLRELMTRGARVAAAARTVKSVDLGIAWREWQVAQAARLATVRLAMLQRRLGLVRREVGFERRTVSVLQKAIDGGDATVQDLGVHRSALEALKQVEGDLDRTAAATRARLNLLLGLPPKANLEVILPAADASGLAKLPAASAMVERAMKTRLDVQALELGYQAQEARVRRAVLAQFPSLSIGVVRQRNETGIQFLGGFVSLGLPIFNRNQGEIALARATRSRLGHELEARIAGIRSQISELHTADGLLARQIREARSGAAALAKVERAEHDGVLAGDVDRLAWQGVRSTLLDVQLKLAALVQARLETRVALTTAVGRPPVRPRTAAASATSAPPAGGHGGQGPE